MGEWRMWVRDGRLLGVAAPVPRPTVGTGPASECGETMVGTTGVGVWLCSGLVGVAAFVPHATGTRSGSGTTGWENAGSADGRDAIAWREPLHPSAGLEHDSRVRVAERSGAATGPDGGVVPCEAAPSRKFRARGLPASS